MPGGGPQEGYSFEDKKADVRPTVIIVVIVSSISAIGAILTMCHYVWHFF